MTTPGNYQRIWRLSSDRTKLVARGAPDIFYAVQPPPPPPGSNRQGIITRIRGRAVYTPVSPPADRSSLVAGTYKPDSTNTGVLAGSTLVEQSADITYGTNGQVIQDRNFTGKVSVTGQDITIKNSYLRGNPLLTGPCLQCTNTNVRNLLIQDCTIEQQNLIWDSPGVKGHNVTLLRCWIKGCTDGFQHIGVGGTSYDTVDQNIVIQQCLIEKGAYMSPDPGAAGGLVDNASHLDCIQLRGGRNFLIWGNSLQAFLDPNIGAGGYLPINLPSGTHAFGNKYATTLDPSYQGTSVIMCSPQLGRMGNFMVKENWMDGASYMVNYPHTQVDVGGTAAPAPFNTFAGTGAQFIGNRIGYNSRGGNNHFIIAPAALPLTISGNVRPDTGAAANFRANG